MKHPIRMLLLAAALTTAAAAHAQVTVNDAWVRATVPQQRATGAFMQLQSAAPARLVSISSPAAGMAEIHEMSMQDNTMKMRAVSGVDLPAGKTVEFKPGGYHVMLMDLKQPVSAGATVPLTLVVEGADGKRTSIEVAAPVRALGSAAAGSGGGEHAGHGDHAGHGSHGH